MPRFTHATGQHLTAGDARLYVEASAGTAGEPLLLLHGGLGSLVDFNTLLDGLPPELRCIGIDFRGHGRSTLGSEALSYALYERDVLQVLDHLGVARCSLLGFSDGGIVALRLAARYPDRVRALVTVGAQWRLDAGGPVEQMLRGLTAELWTEMAPDSVRHYQAVNPEPGLPRLIEALIGLWTDGTAAGYPGPAVARIQAPCLLVRGDGDPLLSLRELADLQARLEAAHVFNVPFAGHEVHRDAPGSLLPVLRQFLAQPLVRQPPGGN